MKKLYIMQKDMSWNERRPRKNHDESTDQSFLQWYNDFIDGVPIDGIG